MNGGIVPLVLLGATLALLLAFVSTKTALVTAAACAASASIAFFLPVRLLPAVTFVGLWLTMIIVAVMVYLPLLRRFELVILIGLDAGLWMGCFAGLADHRVGLFIGLLVPLAGIPAKWLVARKFDIIIKVVASWMIAIASLSMFVSLMPTPGYKPDHMQ